MVINTIQPTIYDIHYRFLVLHRGDRGTGLLTTLKMLSTTPSPCPKKIDPVKGLLKESE